MEVARLFGVLPVTLLRLPISEFRLMYRYYKRIREQTENIEGVSSGPGPNDIIVE